MSEQRKIVTAHGTVEELPEKFRGDLDPKAEVVVILLEKKPDQAWVEPRYLKYWGAASHLGTTTEEAVARIRALRDEWD